METTGFSMLPATQVKIKYTVLRYVALKVMEEGSRG